MAMEDMGSLIRRNIHIRYVNLLGGKKQASNIGMAKSNAIPETESIFWRL